MCTLTSTQLSQSSTQLSQSSTQLSQSSTQLSHLPHPPSQLSHPLSIWRKITKPIPMQSGCFFAIIDPNKMANEILTSMENDQLKLDFPRMKLYINSISCSTIDKLCKSVSKLSCYKNNIVKNVGDLILLFCTQASFFYPLNVLYTKFINNDQNIHIVDGKDCPKINIIDWDDHIDIVFIKSFHYVDVDANTIIFKFRTCTIVTINLYDEYMVGSCKKCHVYLKS